MFNYVKSRVTRLIEIKKDPMIKNIGVGATYEKYGFSVGKYTYGHQQFFYKGVNLKEIGAFCSIAKNVSITGMNHPTSYITTNPFIYYKSRGIVTEDRLDLIDKEKNKKVIIGNDVWIGENVTLLPSVKIGNGAIISAGSIVTKDVPDYAIVGGVPAKIIKYRFSKEEIEILNDIKWWEWPNEKIKQNINYFTSNEEFFKLLSK